MCGIVGYLFPNADSAPGITALEAMAGAIVHRGPDDHGYAVDGPAGVGMRRLSIVDPNHGQQPFASPDGRFTLIFNGEIYNHHILRRELDDRGWNFTTHSDTEVLLAAWAFDGQTCLDQLNGMFAFAIWDRQEQCLTLVRDRMGVKPLYYSFENDRFIFASEIKAINASGLVEPSLNPTAIWDYLTFRYVPGPASIWGQIHKLPPGHILRIKPGLEPGIDRWWDIPYVKPKKVWSDNTAQKQFEALFTEAVELRMQADVPVGLMLSGGLDSSAIACAAVEGGHNNLHSFSVSFADSPETDELPYARTVADFLGLRHHEVAITQEDFINFLPQFVRATDEPLADLASIPLFYLSSLARKSVKVVLSGEGADEILGGYTFDSVVADWQSTAPKRKWWQGKDMSFPDLTEFNPPPHMTNYLSSQEKRTMLKGNVQFPDSMERIKASFLRCGTDVPLHRMLYSYCQDWLVEDLLMKADKMSMAASLELRTPFLDYRLVEWAASTPARFKVGQNQSGQLETKSVLRRYAKSRLPRAIVQRPKMGFPVPVYGWLINSVKEWAYEHLSPNARINGFLTPGAIKETLNKGTHSDSHTLDRHRLWNLLILELWLREWTS